MPEFKLKIQWEDAIKQRENAEYQGRLGYNKLEDVEYVNEALKDYDQLTNELDALIHIDATDEHFVYSWRLQQEAVLRKTRGAGMTDEQVINFVDGYYPAYELFTDSLRAGAFSGEEGRQLRIVVGKDRKVREVRRI
ncbi:hypothetical protein MMC28_009854 [Mycoblastus sanguinarius]|nr:hypothetical protein [Mycoblastus sanguinarius]